MKKFTIKGVLDGFRGSVPQPTKAEACIEENLRTDQFQVAKTIRHGFPHQPTALAFDPVQRIIAIGTKTGSLRIFGRPGVDCQVQHDSDSPVLQIIFLINEGALVTVCADDTLHLWNLRQKRPDVVHTLKFQRERITCCQLPFQSKWLYLGTERGNVHIVNIESFVLSGYIINWNKAIELSRKTHPGPVVHLSDNPVDPNKFLIGYETGAVVLWDLRTKAADARYQNSEPLKSVSWHHEGKLFMCSHSDGSLSTWNIRSPLKPISILYPHAKTNKEGKLESCKPINKVEWKLHRNTGEAFTIFSGGLAYDRAGRTPSITVIHGKSTTVLEMEHNVVDFITLCESPWQSDFQDPYAIVVLLQNDLVIVDLAAPGYLCFENPYPMDIHESPVTSCVYLADCPADLIPAFYSVGVKTHKRTGFSEREWPINGGAWGTATCSYAEVIITGHADGSLKFWDASAVSLQILYKLKTAKLFERPKARSLDGQTDDPFAIHQISICPESRVLAIAGASSHVILFHFKRSETTAEVAVLEVPIIYEVEEDLDCSPEGGECPPRQPAAGVFQQGSNASSSDESKKQSSIEYHTTLRVKSGPQRRAAGYQATIVCLTPWVNGEPPGQITTVTVNSSYGLLAYGNESGIVIVDIIQKTCLVSMGTPDLYGSSDPYQRVPRSPKRNQTENNLSDPGDRCRSPTSLDQNRIDAGCSAARGGSSSPSCSPASSFFELTAPRVELTKSISAEAGLAANEVPEFPDGTHLKLNAPPQKAHSSTSILSRNASGCDLKSSDTDLIAQIKATEDVNSKVPLSFNEPDLVSELPLEGEELKKLEKFRRPRSYSWKGFSFKKKVTVDGSSRLSFSGDSSYEEGVPNLTIAKNLESASAPRATITMTTTTTTTTVSAPLSKKYKKRGRRGSTKSLIVDLRNLSDEESPVSPIAGVKKLLTATQKEKIDSSFSRSRSSSMSSLENITNEAVQCLAFSDSYTRRHDCVTCPTLWVGTSLGSVLVIILNLPPAGEPRQTQPVMVSPSGTIFRLKGAIQCIAFLDCSGGLIPYLFQSWKDINKQDGKDRIRTPSKSSTNNRVSPSSAEMGDRQFAVLTSEKQARVVALPSQTCAFKAQLTETSFVVRTDIILMKDDVCLSCYIANGHIAIFSLPSLRVLLDVEFVPLIDLRTARTFCFSNHGHGMYLCSPCEVQKFTMSSKYCENLQEMLGELFLPCEIPEPPKESFFKGLFGGGVRSLDREELFGEASGKASRNIATRSAPGMNLDNLNAKATGVTSEIGRAHASLVERGENLGLLEERTTRMMTDAEEFHKNTHLLANKYKDKKWYQF